MRCKACDVILSDFEATRKYAGTNEYCDLCNDCLGKSDVLEVLTVVERDDLNSFEALEDE